jgi:NADH:ubiquinone oxidoreductase subunit E
VCVRVCACCVCVRACVRVLLWSLVFAGDTADGMFHLMEVECLGACANAPMMQISHAGGDEYFVRAQR